MTSPLPSPISRLSSPLFISPLLNLLLSPKTPIAGEFDRQQEGWKMTTGSEGWGWPPAGRVEDDRWAGRVNFSSRKEVEDDGWMGAGCERVSALKQVLRAEILWRGIFLWHVWKNCMTRDTKQRWSMEKYRKNTAVTRRKKKHDSVTVKNMTRAQLWISKVSVKIV